MAKDTIHEFLVITYVEELSQIVLFIVIGSAIHYDFSFDIVCIIMATSAVRKAFIAMVYSTVMWYGTVFKKCIYCQHFFITV